MTARTIIDDVGFAAMWSQGASYRQISDALGIREGKINAIRNRLGLPTRRGEYVAKETGKKSRTDAERNATIVALREKGVTIPQLALRFGVGATRIRVILRDRHRIEARRKPKPTLKPKPESQQNLHETPCAKSDLPPHPFWNADRDAVLLRTNGSHRQIAELAARWGQSSTYVRARWHRLVAS